MHAALSLLQCGLRSGGSQQRRRLLLAGTALLLAVGAAAPARGQAVAEEARAFTIGEGSLSLEAPASWKRVQPKSGIVETEFAIPSAGDLPPGRMTVMGAGGSVQANVDRWYGQFSQPDGSATKDKATSKTLKLAGCTVTLVDVSGTYKDMPGGPFAGGKTIERPDYRMLAAIVETPEKEKGSYFLKFYGPAPTVAQEADGFRKMIEGMVPAAK
ncbi:MAG: hypothetical protein RLZZ111_2053 [Planctomycetota bacterium]|jgi:hypothetical protein